SSTTAAPSAPSVRPARTVSRIWRPMPHQRSANAVSTRTALRTPRAPLAAGAAAVVSATGRLLARAVRDRAAEERLQRAVVWGEVLGQRAPHVVRQRGALRGAAAEDPPRQEAPERVRNPAPRPRRVREVGGARDERA